MLGQRDDREEYCRPIVCESVGNGQECQAQSVQFWRSTRLSRGKPNERKRRVPTIGFDSGRDAVLTAIKNGPDSSIEFFGEDGQRFYPADAWLDSGYERENRKRKVVTRIWTGSHTIHRDPHDALRRFDHLLAIDTNTAPGDVGVTACSFSTELIFATADKTDFICNKLIRRCDQRAEQVKRALSQGEVPGELQSCSNGYYSQSRHWPVVGGS